MGCACSSPRTGSLSSTFLPQNQIMSPELREDIHEDLGVSLVACSLKGWRKTQEDTSAIVINLGGRKDMLGVGVFDGHSGQEASKYVAENMWNQVIATTEWGHGDIAGALKAAFLAVDANMQRDKVCHGTTAVVAVLTPGNLYVANCGDSRAVLCKEGVATAMSTDHKPCVYTERSRVIRCGGQQVIPGEFGGVARVTAPGSMVAMATSRSLGDFHFKRNYNADQSEQVVSPAAEVVCVRRALGDEFLILGTDGVWDVLSNQEVGDMMRGSNRTRIPRVPAPPPPPSVVWENSSSQASAAAAAAAAAENSRRDAADGGGRAGKASREPGAPQSLGATMSQKAGGVPTDYPAGATNGFLPAAVPTTPYHPPVTPHNLQQTTPFGARAAASASAAAAAGAGADPYDSSDCGSSDAGDDAVGPSQVGMSIDGESSGGSRRPGEYFTASSAATGSKRPPAFIRLITPTLLRLVTPTPPNPANGPPRPAAAAASEATAAKEGVAGGGKGRNSPPPVAVGGASTAVRDGARAEVKPGSDSGKGDGSVGKGPSVAGQGESSDVMTELVCAYAGETGAESESAAAATTGGGTPGAASPAAPASEASASEISAAAAAAANSSSQAEGTELTSVAGARSPASDDKPVCLAVGVDEAGVPPGGICSSEASKVSSGKEGVHAGGAQSAPHNNEPIAGEKERDHALRLPVGEPGSLSSSSSSSSITAGELSPSDKKPPEKGKDGTVGEGLDPKQGVAGDKDKDKVGGVPDGGGGGSWSTTPPPRPPVSLPRRGSGEGASARASAAAPEASGVGSTSSSRSNSVVDDSTSAPAAPAASVATKPAANGHHDDDNHGGITSRARNPGTGASSVVTPNPSGGRASGSSDGGGITPSARTPGASSGGGGVSTAGTTPASARTPGGGAFGIGGSSSSGGGGGTWTSGGVGQTPSRRPSTSRGATPSRVSSYRRSNGSGINLGLFKGSSSLSVSLSGQGDRSAIGAVQGVLDQALLKGSQDNMTLIAVDLRGFLEASSPNSDSDS
ncbi:unnamed protein product [Ectocarpus sp. 6 AP-2014]